MQRATSGRTGYSNSGSISSAHCGHQLGRSHLAWKNYINININGFYSGHSWWGAAGLFESPLFRCLVSRSSFRQRDWFLRPHKHPIVRFRNSFRMFRLLTKIKLQRCPEHPQRKSAKFPQLRFYCLIIIACLFCVHYHFIRTLFFTIRLY